MVRGGAHHIGIKRQHQVMVWAAAGENIVARSYRAPRGIACFRHQSKRRAAMTAAAAWYPA
jgi:hypothetical protein